MYICMTQDMSLDAAYEEVAFTMNRATEITI